jgi:hypothetical protein
MTANIMLKLHRDLLRKIRVLVAEKYTSVSGFLAEQLESALREHHGHEQAKKSALARMKQASHLGYTPPASRDQFYER